MMRKWLQEIRERRALTMEEMASQLEIEPDYYELIENGNLPLNIPVLIAAKISECFEVPLSWIIIYEQEYKEQQKAK